MSHNSSIDVVSVFLNALAKGTVPGETMDPKLIYISLNHSNAELAQIMPWTGTHHGPTAFKEAVAQMLAVWDFHGGVLLHGLAPGCSPSPIKVEGSK